MGAIIKGEGNLERSDSRGLHRRWLPACNSRGLHRRWLLVCNGRGLHRRWLPVCNGKRRTCKSAIRKKRQKQ